MKDREGQYVSKKGTQVVHLLNKKLEKNQISDKHLRVGERALRYIVNKSIYYGRMLVS